MTRQEAIDVLTEDYPDAWYEEDLREAFDMAIEALKADVPGTNDGDMISRKAAIEALKEAFNPSITNFVKAKIAIDKLPSAQPEIIRCKDCKYWQDQEEEVVEVPICARPENKYEKFPFVMLLEDGEDRYKCEHHEDGSLKWTYLECDKCGRKTLAYCYEYQATELWNEGKTEEEQ